MSRVAGNQEFSLRIDDQHRQIAALFNALRDSVANVNRLGPAQILLFDELATALEEHFRTEEAMMRLQSNWPQRFGWHIDQHRTLLYEFIKLREDASWRDAASNLKLLDYLGRWLLEHMSIFDCDLDQLRASECELDRDLLELGAPAHEPVPWLIPEE